MKLKTQPSNMKKYIPIILAIIFFCASSSVKMDLWNIKKEITQDEYFCMQDILAEPIIILGGLTIIIFPRMFLGWMYAVFGKKPDIPRSTMIFLQIVSAIAVILSFRDLFKCWHLFF